MKLLQIDGKLPIKIGTFFVSIFMIIALLPPLTVGAAGGDDVTLTVTINNTVSGKTYGPDNVVLKFTGNISDTANSTPMYIGDDIVPSDVITQTNSESSRSDDSSVSLRATFANVPAGKYKVCYEVPNSACSSEFEKISGVPASASIVLGADDVALLPSVVSGSADTSKASCGSSVPGVGWIVCPIINMLTVFNDAMWWVTSSLLTVNPISQSGAIYNAWTVIRNLANVVFVVVFLIVIFSQVSSVGISNYGIKKMLPRLVVAAILVNISFVIVQVLVDVANIVGASLYELMKSVTPNNTIDFGWGKLVALMLAGGATGAGLVWGGVVLSGGLAAAFWMLLPIALAGMLALLAAMLTLIFRQAIIPVLAIMAPLAFVAYLLPNTQSWFNKWKDLLISMLMLYPLASLVFGGVNFASKAIIGDGTKSWEMLIGLIMLSLPLFSLPFLARKSSMFASNIMGGLKSMYQKPLDAARKGSTEMANQKRAQYDIEALKRFNSSKNTGFRRAVRNPRGAWLGYRMNQERMGRDYGEDLEAARADFLAEEKNLPTGASERMKARAVSLADEIDTKAVNTRKALLADKASKNPGEKPQIAMDALLDSVNKIDSVGARAAAAVLMKESGGPGKNNLYKAIQKIQPTTENANLLNSLKYSLTANGVKDTNVALDSWSNDDANLSFEAYLKTKFNAQAALSGLNPDQLAGQSKKFLLDFINDVEIGDAQAVLNSQSASSKLDATTRKWFIARSKGEAVIKPQEASDSNQQSEDSQSSDGMKIPHEPSTPTASQTPINNQSQQPETTNASEEDIDIRREYFDSRDDPNSRNYDPNRKR
jgi:hypothetical protein